MNKNSTAAQNVIPFDFRGHTVRALTIRGEPWFVASDVCRALDVANTTQAVQALDDDERSMFNIGRQGSANIVNESGLYTLVLRSRDAVKKGSKQHAFRKWVTAEVLPAIRKHGRYEDSAGQMGGLVFEAIGVSELTAIKGVIQDKAKSVPKEKRISFIQTMHRRLHTRFNVQRTELIPHKDFADACNFVAAYVLEGEWLEKEQEAAASGVISLSAYEAQHVYLLMSRLAVIGKHSSSLGEAGRALGSEPMKSVYSQLLESRVSFGFLDKAIGSRLYQAYRSLGLDGGYRSVRAQSA
jgi:prophage antirepressor-like protein